MVVGVIVLGLILAAIPNAASANVIFPAAILTGRLLAWWVIAASLVIETVFVRLAFRLSLRDAIFVTLGANAVSAVFGLFLLPYLGMFAELGLFHSGVAELIGFDTFNLQSWILAFVLAVALNLAIEIPVYRYGYRLPIGRRAFWLIFLANVITAGVAFASLDFVRDPDYGEVAPGILAK